MDQIQMALEKAKFRLADGSVSLERKSSAPPHVANDAAWTAVPRIEADTKLLERHRIVAADGDHPARAQYDMLRTTVSRKLRQNNWTTLAVTSPSAGCGKTSVVLNLALSLSRQKDCRTLLVDLDLRSPTIGKLLGIPSGPPLERVLKGEADFKQCLVRLDDNFAVAANGQPVRFPAELLQSGSAGRVLKAMRQLLKPDVILFDLPPMLVADDVMAILPAVDAVILVAAAGETTLHETDICEQTLSEHGKMLGVVLNKCRHHQHQYGY